MTGIAAALLAITIGAGPWLGRTAGRDWYEELQDWRVEDVRALDAAGDVAGGDPSRDLVALYARDEGDSLFLRVDLLDLELGAEAHSLNVIFLIDCAPGGETWLPDFVRGRAAIPWDLALIVYDAHAFRLYDASWNALPANLYRGAYFRADLDGMETGVAKEALRRAGWDGVSPVRLQAITVADGVGEVSDSIGPVRSDARAGTAKLVAILHGNQPIANAADVEDLVFSDRILTPDGNPTGYHRALDTHAIFGVPPSIHVSGTLAAALQWAENRHDARRDGPAFNRRLRGFLDGDRANGEGALVGGVLAEHILPYFESRGDPKKDVTARSAAAAEAFYREVYGISRRPRVFWTPERVIRGTTFADIRRAGYEFTVIDQVTHIWQWFGKAEALSPSGYKLNRIGGVSCFLVNDEADQWKFASTDGGLWIGLRHLLLGKALDPDQEQVVVVFDDWEAYAGRSFTSFGRGSDNPDNWNRNVRWIANHPWVQAVTADDVASWGWRPVERGDRPDLPVETYDWLRHASEGSYDHWYHGLAGAEESFRDLRLTLRHGQAPAPMPLGDLHAPGTLLHDVWRAVDDAPAGALKDLALHAYLAAIYETAWHDEDQDDYARDPDGRYLRPDRTYDRVSNWAYGAISRLSDAAVVAAAARWAATVTWSATWARLEDIDLDGELEAVISNDRVLLVLEDDGGRLAFAFARQPATGEARALVGPAITFPGASRETEWEGARDDDARRVSALRDVWATGPGTGRYVNERFAVTPVARGFRLVSPDGKVTKEVTLADGASEALVRYRLDPSLGTLYVRLGLSPSPLTLARRGPGALFAGDDGRAYRLAAIEGRVEARASIVYSGPGLAGARRNASMTDGTGFTPRNVALVHQVELAGERELSFLLGLEVRRR